MTNLRTGVRLTSAAALFALSTIATAATPPSGSQGAAVGANDTVHCYGLHSCKGNSDCKTTAHECKGQNECKGHGFKALKASQCLSKGGTIGDLRS